MMCHGNEDADEAVDEVVEVDVDVETTIGRRM